MKPISFRNIAGIYLNTLVYVVSLWLCTVKEAVMKYFISCCFLDDNIFF